MFFNNVLYNSLIIPKWQFIEEKKEKSEVETEPKAEEESVKTVNKEEIRAEPKELVSEAAPARVA